MKKRAPDHAPADAWNPAQDAPVAVLGKKLPTATTAYSASGAAVHGLMTVMPAARKGASSRVATLKRREAAMAAIWAKLA